MGDKNSNDRKDKDNRKWLRSVRYTDWQRLVMGCTCTTSSPSGLGSRLLE
jgi:hypothetical protein